MLRAPTVHHMFDSILITGDGEVAARVERTCKRIGMDIAAPGDDESTRGWRPDTASVLSAARRTKAQAVHPGYVAPATRLELARAVREAELVFVGPSTGALEVMQDKLALRSHADEAGIRIVPGGSEPCADLASARSTADELGYPVYVKPLSGTAALGVEHVESEEDLEDALVRSRRTAQESFGDDRVFLEKAIDRPRQIEVTVVADVHGARAALGERESSLQQDRRVLVAESPSPLLLQRPDGEAMRESLVDAALRIADGIGLTGLATFEFLLDADANIYFLEANSDMHGAILVTELLTGIDPIEMQLELAAGDPLTEDSRFETSGHAFEVRLFVTGGGEAAERPVETLRFPPAPHGKVRIEPTVELGSRITWQLEPLLARVATYAGVRHQALLALDRTLAETAIGPMETNIPFLRRVLNHDAFRFGQYDTSFAAHLD